MEAKDREYRKLKLGLALKKIMEESKPTESEVPINDISSFRKFESSTGIRHASLIKIVNGEKNAAWSTIDVILEGLEMTLTQFGSYYDSISEKEVLDHKKSILKKKQERIARKKTATKKKELTSKKGPSKKTFSKKSNKK